MFTHTITLPFGFQSKDGGEPVRRIVFGKRPTAADSIRIQDDPQSDSDTQRPLMYARAAIVSFEEKKRPPHLSELLSLNRADREAVIEGYMEFLSQSIGDRASEKLDADTLRLAIGLEEGSETFDLVTLCDKASLLTGYEEQKIEREAAGEYEQTCILLGYDIASLSQSEGSGSIEGPLSLDRIKRLDAFDLNFMMGAVGERRRLFRRTREAVPSDVRNGSGPDSD